MTAAALRLTPVAASWTPSIEDIERGEKLNIMPYATTKKFLDEIARLKEEINELKKLKGRAAKPVNLNRLEKELGGLVDEKRKTLQESCAIIYQNATIGTLPFVLGGKSLRSSTDKNAIAIACNFGILSGEDTLAPDDIIFHKWSREILPETSPKTFQKIPMQLKTGSVLWDKTWSVFKNDCVMLGIIHSSRECYIARIGKGTLDDDLWEEKSGRPKVLGREIAMLVRAGYVQTFPTVPPSSVAGKNLVDWSGYHFVCQDREAASAITLKDIVDAAEAVKTLDELKKMLTSSKEASSRPGGGSPLSVPAISRPGGDSPSSPASGGSSGADSPPRLVGSHSVAATGGAGTG